jgi:hypothetical protein
MNHSGDAIPYLHFDLRCPQTPIYSAVFDEVLIGRKTPYPMIEIRNCTEDEKMEISITRLTWWQRIKRLAGLDGRLRQVERYLDLIACARCHKRFRRSEMTWLSAESKTAGSWLVWASGSPFAAEYYCSNCMAALKVLFTPPIKKCARKKRRREGVK